MEDKGAMLQRFYRWNAPIYDATRWAILRGRREAVAALFAGAPSDGARVLDIGCGTGLNFPLLRERIGPGGLIVGVDLSAHMLNRAKRRCGRRDRLLRADAARLPIEARFDAVLMAYSLSMIPEWQTAVARACRRLTPGGRIVIVDFGRRPDRFAPLRHAMDYYLRLNHVDPGRDYENALIGHVERVEALRPADAYYTILRGTAKKATG